MPQHECTKYFTVNIRAATTYFAHKESGKINHMYKTTHVIVVEIVCIFRMDTKQQGTVNIITVKYILVF